MNLNKIIAHRENGYNSRSIIKLRKFMETILNPATLKIDLPTDYEMATTFQTKPGEENTSRDEMLAVVLELNIRYKEMRENLRLNSLRIFAQMSIRPAAISNTNLTPADKKGILIDTIRDMVENNATEELDGFSIIFETASKQKNLTKSDWKEIVAAAKTNIKDKEGNKTIGMALYYVVDSAFKSGTLKPKEMKEMLKILITKDNDIYPRLDYAYETYQEVQNKPTEGKRFSEKLQALRDQLLKQKK